jgi:hypothetical protein
VGDLAFDCRAHQDVADPTGFVSRTDIVKLLQPEIADGAIASARYRPAVPRT